MLLALLNMTMIIPLGLFSIYLNSHGVQLAPWISWEDVHFNFSCGELVPSIIWRSNPSFNTSVKLMRWLFPFPLSYFLPFSALPVRLRNNTTRYSIDAIRPLDWNLHLASHLKSHIYQGQFFFRAAPSLLNMLFTIFALSYNWTQPGEKVEYASTDSASGKASRFSLTSSKDHWFRYWKIFWTWFSYINHMYYHLLFSLFCISFWRS